MHGLLGNNSVQTQFLQVGQKSWLAAKLFKGGEGEFHSLSSSPAHMPPKEPSLPMRFSFVKRGLSGIIILRLSPTGFNFATEPFMTSKR